MYTSIKLHFPHALNLTSTMSRPTSFLLTRLMYTFFSPLSLNAWATSVLMLSGPPLKRKVWWWCRCGEGKEEEEREGANGRLCQQKYTPLAWISGGSSLTSRRRWFLYIQVRITASVTLLYPYTETSQLTSGPREGPRGRIFPPHSLQTVETCLWWRPPDSLSGPQLRQRDRNGCSTIHCDKVSLQLKLLGWTFSLESFVSL